MFAVRSELFPYSEKDEIIETRIKFMWLFKIINLLNFFLCKNKLILDLVSINKKQYYVFYILNLILIQAK